MIKAHGYAAQNAMSKLAPFSFTRREVGEKDVLIEIRFCGICHSDIHQARDEWRGSVFPMVPGHEIVGQVKQVGNQVKKFKVGDIVGVGCMVDSCRQCESCQKNLEQYCEAGFNPTYNGYDKKTNQTTFGGYSNCIVVDEDFVLQISDKLPLERVAPLLCAGITTYSPMKHWHVAANQKIGVMGLGGLGHMAVKFGKAFGAHVVVFTTSEHKIEDALRLGAKDVVLSKNPAEMSKHINSFDFIINTISAPIDLIPYIALLKLDGVMVQVGVPIKDPVIHLSDLVFKRRTLAGSLIGGLQETQEMLDFCAKHNIACDVEVISIDKVNEAYERTLKGDVKYRFVINMDTLKS